MRIQHNIPAMSSYRNYINNTNAVSKNLEKLSSGYKINRAGDDAAGLAISEKMRAQITGLQAAQKNAKDGISLVKTAEGALTEVHDMLNRMVNLATQSANGTYDNETDRAQLQKEMDQLTAEIDRIADSSNFNGIKLLDGAMDARVQINETKDFSKYYGSDPTGGIDNDESNVNKPGHVFLHEDSTGSAKTVFSVNLHDKTIQVGDKGKVALSLATWASNGAGNGNEGQAVLSFSAAAGTELTGDMVAEKLAQSANGGKVTIMVGKDAGGDGQGDVGVEYSVTAKDGILTFTMTDTGLTTAQNAIATNPSNTGVFQGNFTWGLWNSDADPANKDAVTDANSGDATGTGKEVINAGSLGNNNYGTTIHNVGSDSAKKRLARAGVDVAESIKDGGGVKVGDTNYVWAMTDKTLNAVYDDNTKVIDIRDLCENGKLKANPAADAANAGDATPLQRALSRFTDAAEDNKMFNVEYAVGNDSVYFTERESNTNTEVLTTLKGLKSQIQIFDPAKTSVNGTALTLQIGDTADSYNQLRVSIADMHAKALGLDKIKISDQTSAAEAVDKIKAAINMVSDVRGTLGATQNRLDHTINNLSVMTENIQDAESTIRDTDIAEEMMAYTKNNILVQSAQAMLAQANQIPQGVLQLLG